MIDNPLDKVMEAYNEAFSKAKDFKQEEAVNKKFEKRIDSAEKQFESNLDKQNDLDMNEIESEINKVQEEISKSDAKVEAELKAAIKNPPGSNVKPIAIEDKYTLKELRKLATKYKIKGRSKMKEKQLIEALLKAEVKL